MSLLTNDTIVAIASAAGGALRGIIRVSGPQTVSIAESCFVPNDSDCLTDAKHPTAFSGVIDLAPPLGEIPTDLYLWPTNRSYTRQPSAEFHTFGSPPILDAIVRSLCENGARLAEPGEFTMRAFLAGRLDLTQAEAVLGVIDARNQRELDVALEQLAGGLASPLHELREDLLNLLAHLEAGLDFVEEDIEFISNQRLSSELAKVANQIRNIASQMDSRVTTSDHVRIVLRGSPNAGKSSLFNALSSDAAAIVTDVAGTTRDYVTRELQIEGIPCLLIDTAGIDDVVEQTVDIEAQDKSIYQATSSHIELFCVDASRPRNAWEDSELADENTERIVVWTKCDLQPQSPSPLSAVSTSANTGEGLDSLRATIADRVLQSQIGNCVVPNTAIRCRESIRHALEYLERANDAVTTQLGEELVAAEIRGALDELGKVVGAVYTDDVLDRIFSSFCIGK